MVNAKKIAELANVSRSTVQRALSGNPNVAEGTKTRIMEIAEELGYSINKSARALVMRQQKIEYGVVFNVPENNFYREVLRGIEKAKDEIAEYGVKIDVRIMEKIEGKQQADLIHQLVEEKKKGIVFVPFNTPEVREAVNWGKKQGVSFVAVISDIEGTDRLCFVGQNLYKSGLVAGNIMAKLIQGGGEIACFVGSTSFSAHRDRLKGFTDRFTETHPSESIIAVLENFDSGRLSVKLAHSLLDEHPDLNGIYVAGAGVSGICQAVKEKGLDGKIKLISYDLIQSKEYCADGTIDFVIDQDPVQEGYMALQVLNNYIMFDEKPEAKVYTKVDIRTSDNLD